MRRSLLRFAFVAAVVAAPVGLSAAPRVHAVDPSIDRGQGVAQRRCVECHAVRPGRDSSDGDAPPFTVLRLRYNELSLARRIAAVTHGEHAGMPPTAISDADLKDLVAYIQSLGEK